MSENNQLLINSVSDLHLEFYDIDNLPNLKFSNEAEILILAGDIFVGNRKKGVDPRYTQWIIEAGKKFKHVLFIPGNHDYYSSRMDKMIREFRKQTVNTNVILLDKEVFMYKNYKFIGSTNWYDFRLFSKYDWYLENFLHQDISRITDFKKIQCVDNGSYRKLSPKKSLILNRESKSFILKELNKDDGYKNILITHHGVFKESVAEDELGKPLVFTESNDWGDEVLNSINPPVLVINGHSHQFKDIKIKNTRLFINAMGYNEIDENNESYLIDDFKSDYLIKV